MPAETLNCPMCGAPAATDASRCDHCGARLATVACPSCFGMVFAGAEFCSHCGAKIAPVEAPVASHLPCPRCRVDMDAVVIGNSNMRECPRCEGLWVEADTLRLICADQVKQVAVLGMAAPLPPETGDIEGKIRYLRCPVCNVIMNRVNFAHCSHVIVDVCAQHGTWFDKDELRRIIEFIRAGGLDQARAREIAQLDEKRRLAGSASTAAAWDPGEVSEAWDNESRHSGISIAASVLKALLGD